MTCGLRCVPGADTDGDGMLDCAEEADGSDWTDPLIFNGVHARQRNQCSSSAVGLGWRRFMLTCT